MKLSSMGVSVAFVHWFIALVSTLSLVWFKPYLLESFQQPPCYLAGLQWYSATALLDWWGCMYWHTHQTLIPVTRAPWQLQWQQKVVVGAGSRDPGLPKRADAQLPTSIIMKGMDLTPKHSCQISHLPPKTGRSQREVYGRTRSRSHRSQFSCLWANTQCFTCCQGDYH